MTTINIKQGSNLDEYFQSHRTNTRFVLGPGVYYVSSAWSYAKWDYCLLGPECELIGAGARYTTVIVTSPLSTLPTSNSQIECFTAGSRSEACTGIRIEGIRIVAPDAQDPKVDPFVRGLVGLHIWSDWARVEDVEVVGVTGTRTGGNISTEGFGVLLNESGQPGVNVGTSIIKNVSVEVTHVYSGQAAQIYVTGFYCGYAKPNGFSVCENIQVINRTGVLASVAFGVNSKVLGSRWVCVGKWDRGIYTDVVGGRDVLITDSVLEVVSTAVEFQTGPSQVWESVVVTNSVIRFSPTAGTQYCSALVLRDNAYLANTSSPNQGKFKAVQLRNCVLIAEELAGTSSQKRVYFYTGGVSSKLAQDCGLIACTKIGAWRMANLVPGAAVFYDC